MAVLSDYNTKHKFSFCVQLCWVSGHGVDSDEELETVDDLQVVEEGLETVEGELETVEDLETKLKTALNGCSKQRLRAMKMTLHKRANVDSRVTYKDLTQVLQVGYSDQ